MIALEETETADEEFYKSFEAWENETTDDFIKRYSRTEIELKETIDYLIRHREMIRDVELKQLEREANKLIDRLRGLERQKLIA